MTRECFVHPPGVNSIRIDHSPHAAVGRLHGVSDDEHPGSRYRLRPWTYRWLANPACIALNDHSVGLGVVPWSASMCW